MQEGLVILTTPGGSFPYVRVGWLKHRAGDVWEIHGARVLRRFGSGRSIAGLAAEGPASDTQLLEPAAMELVHTLHMIRFTPANEKAWKTACPRPEATRSNG